MIGQSLYVRPQKAVSPLPELHELTDDLDDIFDGSFNEALVHQAVVTHEANQRTDLASAKTRSEVSGRNKKPWRQKGTGRSRHGSRISPLWVGGGQAHAPDGTQDHSKELTQKMKRHALTSALSVRRSEGALFGLEGFDYEEPSTSDMDEFFTDENLQDRKVLLLHTAQEDTVRLSVRNLPYCDPFEVNGLNTYQVVAHDRIVFTEDALDAFKERVEA